MKLFSKKRNRRRNRMPQKTTWRVKPKRSRLTKLRQLLKGKVIIAFALLLIFSGLVYGIFYSPLLLIHGVEVTTEYKDINIQKLEKAVTDRVLNQHSFSVRLSEVESELYSAFPEVSSLFCQRNFFRQMVQCNALGYELIAVIKHRQKKYYINENGTVIGYDNRKLGLPLFDLILNPIYTDGPQEEERSTSSLPLITPEVNPDPSVELEVPPSPVLPEDDGEFTFNRLKAFIDEAEKQRHEAFEVTVGKQILNPTELKTILESITKLETLLERKVTGAQYVQVAGELTLTSKVKPKEEGEKPSDADETPQEGSQTEDLDHEIKILFDLRRNLEDQFIKLQKAREAIDFATIQRIDLSIDGEKVFYY